MMKTGKITGKKVGSASVTPGLSALNAAPGTPGAGISHGKKNRAAGTDYDSAWKDLIELVFPEFIKFFFPQIYDDIDFSYRIEFLSQELRKIIPKNKQGKRLADVVAKVRLKDGSTGCIFLFIHIEVQGKPEEDFPGRMFVYMYRLYDKFKDSGTVIISLAVLTDEDVNYRPDEFKVSRWGYELKMKIPIVKIIDYLYDEKKKQELENSDNPLALVVRAQLRSYEAKKLDNTKKFDIKKNFIRECYAAGYKKQVIEALLKFFDWLFVIPDILEQKLADEIEKLEEEFKMPYVTSWERLAERRGEERGIYRQAKASAKRMWADHFPIETISKYLGIPIEEIKKLLATSPVQ